MTEEEKIAATEEDMVSLRSRRESKELGSWHNADITASRDTSITVSRIKDEVSSLSSIEPASANQHPFKLQRLNSRTGDESILWVTRGSVTRFHPAESYCSSERAESFLSTVLKSSGEDLALRMDAYMVLGIEGKSNSKASAISLLFI